ncbi:MAG TPA: glycosyl hydrolase [Actinomycetota bacterium]|nr:glycosyl hydrolase [Actinomycetota bacterium]
MTHHGRKRRGTRRPVVKGAAAILAAVAIAAGVIIYNRTADPGGPLPVDLPPSSGSYLGVYTAGIPDSYTGVTTFAKAAGARPDVVMYYSGWFVPFPSRFAQTAASEGSVPLVQMDPDNVNVAAIASGRYDAYLSAYAEAIRNYRHPVILSFGHEMNGTWYSWGYRHTTPQVFVAAWRHIVNLFRALGAHNVTWLWTVNIINNTHGGSIPAPNKWWPGSSYVTWVGIDGYYLKPTWKFAPLFGPTIDAVRHLTADPILIAETGAVPAADQPAKIHDLFAGIRQYGLLGFVWFDSTNSAGQQFDISSTASFDAFRKGASTFSRPGS